MNKLHKYAFHDLYDISSGISTTKNQAGHGYPFVSFSTVFNNYFLPDKLPDLMNTTDTDRVTYSVKKGDIFVTRTSETIDELAMSCVALKDYPTATYSGFLKRLRPKPESAMIVYDKYMAFFLRSQYFRKIIVNNTSMTLRASFNEDIFSYLSLYLPDYDEQVKIGDFLYNLEVKKNINNKIAVELEKIANTIYDYWFLQFEFPNEEGKPYKSSGGKMVWNEELKREIPEGWSSGTLSDYGDIVGGGTPPTSNQTYYTESYEEIAWLTPYDLANTSDKYIEHGARDITKEGLQKSSAVLMPAGTVLMTSRAPIGYLAISQNEICTNQGFKSIVPNKNYGKEFIYYSLQALMPSIKAQGVGSTFSEISGTTLKRIICLRPDINISNKFEKIIEKTANRRFICEAENRQLTSLRDFLLPLLMNGQVTFKDDVASEEE